MHDKLAALADDRGLITGLALDHRAPFAGDGGTMAKVLMVEAMSTVASTVLVDEPSLAACAAVVAPGCGLMGGFEPDPSRGGARQRVEAIAAAGAVAVKYYVLWKGLDDDPGEVDEVVRAALDVHLPVVLEPYLNKPGDLAGAARWGAARQPDLLKVNLPRSADAARAQADACGGLPFVYLGGSTTLEALLDRLETLGPTGACGVLVGRALWADGLEAFATQGEQGLRWWLDSVGLARMRALRATVERRSVPL